MPIGNEFPARPSDKHKNGVRFMIKLSKDCGGDKPIREIAGTSKAFLSGIEAVYTQYLAEKDKHPGKLPVIVLEKTTPVKTGTGEQSSPTIIRRSRSSAGRRVAIWVVPMRCRRRSRPAAPPSTGSTPRRSAEG